MGGAQMSLKYYTLRIYLRSYIHRPYFIIYEYTVIFSPEDQVNNTPTCVGIASDATHCPHNEIRGWGCTSSATRLECSTMQRALDIGESYAV